MFLNMLLLLLIAVTSVTSSAGTDWILVEIPTSQVNWDQDDVWVHNDTHALVTRERSRMRGSAVVVVEDLQEAAQRSPASHFMSLEEIDHVLPTAIAVGSTYENRTIRVVVLGRDPERQQSPQKPIILLNSGSHAREWLAVGTTMEIIRLLSQDEEMLRAAEWHIIPVLNRDGYHFSRSHPAHRLWRKTRVPSFSGSHCIGFDPNRNFPAHWNSRGGYGSSGDPCSEIYRGPTPLVPHSCTAAFARYVSTLERERIRLYADIHAYASSWTSPWGWTRELPPEYHSIMLPLMQEAQRAIKSTFGHTFRIGTATRTLGYGDGGSDDYLYSLGVVPSFTIEVRGSSFIAPASDIPGSGREIYAGLRAVVRKLLK